MTTHLKTEPAEAPPVDAREPVARLLRDLRTTPHRPDGAGSRAGCR